MRNSYGMQFIMDGNGNYYRTNKDNQLVVAANREEASVFTLFDANQRIGGGKKATFYFTIPVGDECGGSKTPIEKVDYVEKDSNRFNIAHFDWGIICGNSVIWLLWLEGEMMNLQKNCQKWIRKYVMFFIW